jgi:hypothetical protein
MDRVAELTVTVHRALGVDRLSLFQSRREGGRTQLSGGEQEDIYRLRIGSFLLQGSAGHLARSKARRGGLLGEPDFLPSRPFHADRLNQPIRRGAEAEGRAEAVQGWGVVASAATIAVAYAAALVGALDFGWHSVPRCSLPPAC